MDVPGPTAQPTLLLEGELRNKAGGKRSMATNEEATFSSDKKSKKTRSDCAQIEASATPSAVNEDTEDAADQSTAHDSREPGVEIAGCSGHDEADIGAIPAKQERESVAEGGIGDIDEEVGFKTMACGGEKASTLAAPKVMGAVESTVTEETDKEVKSDMARQELSDIAEDEQGALLHGNSTLTNTTVESRSTAGREGDQGQPRMDFSTPRLIVEGPNEAACNKDPQDLSRADGKKAEEVFPSADEVDGEILGFWDVARKLAGPIELSPELLASLEEEDDAVSHDEALDVQDMDAPMDIDCAGPTLEDSLPESQSDLNTQQEAKASTVFDDSMPGETPEIGDTDVKMADPEDVDCSSSDDSDEETDAPVRRAAKTKKGVDIQLLSHILDEGIAATSAIDRSSDVVLVLGDTGVGKSTFIQAANDKEFVRDWNSKIHKASFKVEESQDDQGESEIGHGLKSRTRHVRSFYRAASETYFVDSSGFDDTTNIETDIATSICVRELAQRAGRLRFVVLVSAIQFYSKRAVEVKRNLDVVSKFIGHNFMDHKKSFVFLFTHCNHAFLEARDLIKEGASGEDVVALMRQVLLSLLTETKKATPNPSPTRSLLKFLEKSLKNGDPYCDVFDPVLSDIAAIRKNVQPATACSFMDEPEKFVKCSLTYASQHAVRHEIESRQTSILNKLKDGVLDENLASDVLAIRSLSNRIDVVGKKWVEELASHLSRLYLALKNQLHGNISAAWNETDDQIPGFGEVDAARKNMERLCFVRDLLEMCNDAPRKTPTDIADSEEYASLLGFLQDRASFAEQKVAAFDEFIQGKQTELPPMKEPFLILEKLVAWAGVFEAVSVFLCTTKERIRELLLGLTDSTCESSSSDPNKSVRTLALLKAIRRSALASVCLNQADKSNLELVYPILVGKTKCILKSLTRSAHEAVIDAFNSPPSFDEFVADKCLTIHQKLYRCMADTALVNGTIRAGMVRAEMSGCNPYRLATEVAIREYEERCLICSKLVSEASEKDSAIISLCVASLRFFANSMPDKRFLLGLENVERKLLSKLGHLTQNLAFRCSELEAGMLTGTADMHRKSLEQVRAFSWFDSYHLVLSNVEHSSMAISLEASNTSYSRYGDRLSKAASLAFSMCFSANAAIDTVREQLPVAAESFKKLCMLVHVSEEAATSAEAAASPILHQMQIWVDQQKTATLPDSFLHLDVAATGRNTAIAMAIESLPVGKDILNSMAEYLEVVERKIVTYRAEIGSAELPPFDYKTIARTMEKLSEMAPFPEIATGLPSLGELDHKMQDHIHTLVGEIDTLVNGSAANADVTTAEAKLGVLEEAMRHLGAYCKRDAVVIAPLRRSIEMRKAEHDSHFKVYIEDNDFAQIKSFLENMRERNTEQHRLNLKLLSAHLWALVESVRLRLRSPSNRDAVAVANKQMKLLQSAEKQFKGSLRRLPAPEEGGFSWELDGICAKLEAEIFTNLDRCIRSIINATNSLDFESALGGQQHCRMLREFFVVKNRDKRAAAVEAKVEALLSQPGRSIDSFFAALAGAGDRFGSRFSFPPPTAELYGILSALKKSTLRTDCRKEIVDLYADVTDGLTDGLTRLCSELELEWKDGQHTRALRVLGFLQKEFSNGMESHVSVNLDISRMLEEVAASKAQRLKKLQKTELNAEAVDDLVRQLDRQNKSWFTWFAASDYRDNCAAAADKVKEYLGDTLAMIRRSEFNGLRRRIILLFYARSKLHEHLKSTARLGIQPELKSALELFFARTLSGINTALENCNMDYMKDTWFVPLQDLIRELQHAEGPAPDPALNGIDKICSDFQRELHLALLQHCKLTFIAFDEAVEKMDFESVRLEGEKLSEEIGRFLVSHFEFYFHECCRALDDRHLDELVSLVRKKFACGKVLALGRSFATLGLDASATSADVKRSSKRMMRLYHPDKNKDDGASARFLLVKEASDLLEDAENLELFRRHDFPFLLDAVESIPKSIQAAFSKFLSKQEYTAAALLYLRTQCLSDVLGLVKSDKRAKQKTVQRNVAEQAKGHAHALCIDIDKAHNKQDFVQLHHTFADLESFEAAFKSSREILGESLALKAIGRLQDGLLQIQADPPHLKGKSENFAIEAIADFAGKLTLLGRYLEGFPPLKKKASALIHGLLNGLVDEAWGLSFMFKLGMLLEKGEFSGDDDDKRVGRVVVDSFPHFQDVRAVVFNSEVIAVDTAECLAKTTTQVCDGHAILTEAPIDRHTLGAECDKYHSLFSELFSEFVQEGPEQLVNKVLESAGEVKQCRVSNWGVSAKARLTEILAGVCATFTILKSGESFRRFTEHHDDDSGESILFRPHKIQIIAVMRLLGIGTSENTLKNHIMEVRTGEGKSVILGLLAVVLSLLGFSVRCVCYSEHLSERDRELFKDIFYSFDVADRVVYSKITTMSEESVAAEGDIRQLTANMLKGMSPPPAGLVHHEPSIEQDKTSDAKSADRSDSEKKDMITSTARIASEARSGDRSDSEKKDLITSASRVAPLPLNGEQILLVDEVDVFFGPDFYGQTYNQVAEVHEKSVERLMAKLWQSRLEKPSFRSVSGWIEYAFVMEQFSMWRVQIETEVRKMVSDVQDFATPSYEVDSINARIGYRNMDSIDWNLTFGYRTAFAYMNEAEKGTLKGSKAEAIVRRVLALRISCGQFSYANITPTAILGVSGTVGALSAEERMIVKDFNVAQYSFVPSVYGENNFLFDKAGRGITIESETIRHLQSVANEMKQAINKGRSAIAFFEDDDKLLEFQTSVYWKEFRHANVLSSNTDKETRKYVINKAATSGQVTISTAAFGRGTDFFCKDSKLEAAGGMLVIQTFLSVEKSEEVQICGRTARQGKTGSYCMILLETDLAAKFRIKEGEWKDVPREGLYSFLDGRRTTVQSEKLALTKESVVKSGERDSLSRAYLRALVRGDHGRARSELDKIYEFIKAESRQLNFCRMVCLSDATSSMNSIWDGTRHCISEMLRRIEEIGEGQFELMWVAYRDYCDSSVVEKSKWSKNPHDLVKFVSSISTYGGGDYPEAVEEALQVANKENELEPITRVLLIGDAPPHPERKGQPLASHGNRLMTTDYRLETAKLQSHGIPIYTFRLNDEASLIQSFKYMAEATGGESHILNLHSSGATTNNSLIDCVCETALEDIGGSDLVAEYRERDWN